MLANPTADQKWLIFKALADSIAANSGRGFHNADQGHPAYRAGAAGDNSKVLNSEMLGDSPEQNELFVLLESFHPDFHARGPDLSTWQKFCSFATDAHDKATK